MIVNDVRVNSEECFAEVFSEVNSDIEEGFIIIDRKAVEVEVEVY